MSRPTAARVKDVLLEHVSRDIKEVSEQTRGCIWQGLLQHVGYSYEVIIAFACLLFSGCLCVIVHSPLPDVAPLVIPPLSLSVSLCIKLATKSPK